MSVLLRASSLNKAYHLSDQHSVTVLTQVEIDVHTGEFIAIIGPSGSGKSTLLHLLATLDQPDSGTVVYTIDGSTSVVNNLTVDALAHLRNRHIGIVFQFHHLLPEFTVLENVMMPALIGGTPYDEAKTRAIQLLEQVGLQHRRNHGPLELSGGEQQRTSIARALINRPKILFADEPTGNLDHVTAASILDVIARLQEAYNLACVVATHSKDVAQRASRVFTLDKGTMEEGTPA